MKSRCLVLIAVSTCLCLGFSCNLEDIPDAPDDDETAGDDDESDDDVGDDDVDDDDESDDDAHGDDDLGDDDTGGDCWNGAMVRIEAGIFTMGSPDGEHGHQPDEEQHEVTLNDPFEIGEKEITQDEFEACLGYNHRSSDGGSLPVETVSWHEAAHFANRASEDVSLDTCYLCTGSGPSVQCVPDGNPYQCEGYRLPTEAEWEFAARGGVSEQAFPNGGGLVSGSDVNQCDVDVQLSNGDWLHDESWYCRNADQTRTVGSLASNGYGLHDMSGNVWEWCNDWYSPTYGGADSDPTGPEKGTVRVNRGGAWGKNPGGVRVACRREGSHDGDGERDGYTGFRLCRSL